MTSKFFCDHSASSMSGQLIGANDKGGALAIVDEMAARHDTVSIEAAPGGCYFDVFCAERISLTSVFFAGGDWRWTFHAAGGAVLAKSEGYTDEMACRAAVVALQVGAGSAAVQRPMPSLHPMG